jgi:hypothetical protein
MPGSGNFTSVTLGQEGGAEVLKVNGESSGDIDVVETIVVVIESENLAKTLESATDALTPPSASVSLPAGQSGWTATFSHKKAPFDVTDTVLLTGVMTSGDTDKPFVWQQALTIAADTAPANVG